MRYVVPAKCVQCDGSVRSGRLRPARWRRSRELDEALCIRRLEQGAEGSDGPARILTERMPLQSARGRGFFVVGDDHGTELIAQAGVLAAQDGRQRVHFTLRVGKD